MALEAYRVEGCIPNLVACSVPLDGLCKSGAFKKVLDLLGKTEKESKWCIHNVITYNAIIHRFCEKGKSIEAFHILYCIKGSKCSHK